MLTVWLLVLPFAAGLSVWLTRRMRGVATALAVISLLAMAVLLPPAAEQGAFTVFGRSLVLSERIVLPLTVQIVLVVLLVLQSYGAFFGRRFQPPGWGGTLMVMGGMISFVTIENLSIATFALEAGCLGAAAIIALRERSEIVEVSQRIVFVITVATLCIALAALSYEPILGNVEPLLPDRLAAASLALGVALLLATAPFSLWLLALFRKGDLDAIVGFGLLLPLGVFLRLETLPLWVGPAGQRVMMDMFLWGGLATSLVGSLLGAMQDGLTAAYGYLTLEDLGFVMLTVGLGAEPGPLLMMELLLWRMLAITILGMGLISLRRCDVDLALDGVRGMLRRAPLSVLSITLALMALAGLPLGGIYGARLEVLRTLAQQSAQIAIPFAIMSLAGLIYVGRFVVSVCRPLPKAGSKRERIAPAILTALPAAILLLASLVPFILPLWLQMR